MQSITDYKLYMVVKRSIQPNEELTWNYQRDSEEEKKLDCLCKTHKAPREAMWKELYGLLTAWEAGEIVT